MQNFRRCLLASPLGSLPYSPSPHRCTRIQILYLILSFDFYPSYLWNKFYQFFFQRLHSFFVHCLMYPLFCFSHWRKTILNTKSHKFTWALFLTEIFSWPWQTFTGGGGGVLLYSLQPVSIEASPSYALAKLFNAKTIDSKQIFLARRISWKTIFLNEKFIPGNLCF